VETKIQRKVDVETKARLKETKPSNGGPTLGTTNQFFYEFPHPTILTFASLSPPSSNSNSFFCKNKM